MSRNEAKIRSACDKHGVVVDSLKWEPVGGAVEMCGLSGGWILNEFLPIGLSTADAIGYVERFHASMEKLGS